MWQLAKTGAGMGVEAVSNQNVRIVKPKLAVLGWAQRIIGHLVGSVNTIVSALYLGVFWLLGWVRYERMTSWAIVLRAVEGKSLSDNWLSEGWTAWASGAFIVIRHDRLSNQATLRHEERHVQQQMWLGPLQPVLYFIMSVFIWGFLQDKHSYYDNLFERDARGAAGQEIDIPKSWWQQKDNRWYWW